jgi:hypothetical protein
MELTSVNQEVRNLMQQSAGRDFAARAAGSIPARHAEADSQPAAQLRSTLQFYAK